MSYTDDLCLLVVWNKNGMDFTPFTQTGRYSKNWADHTTQNCVLREISIIIIYLAHRHSYREKCCKRFYIFDFEKRLGRTTTVTIKCGVKLQYWNSRCLIFSLFFLVNFIWILDCVHPFESNTGPKFMLV